MSKELPESRSFTDQIRKEKSTSIPAIPQRSFIDRVQGSLVYLIRGVDQNKSAWYYLVLHNARTIPLFLKVITDSNGGKVPLLDYGKIVSSGWGKDPPENVKNEIIKKYS